MDSVFICSPKAELLIYVIITNVIIDLLRWRAHLSDHPVPDASDQLSVLAVGDQVEVVGKLDVAGQLLQDVYAEALAAELGVRLSVADDAEKRECDSLMIHF